MFCTNCGAKILDSAKFCTSCGMSRSTVSLSKPQPQASPAPSQHPKAPQNPAPPPVQKPPQNPAPPPVQRPPQPTAYTQKPARPQPSQTKSSKSKTIIIAVLCLLLGICLCFGVMFALDFFGNNKDNSALEERYTDSETPEASKTPRVSEPPKDSPQASPDTPSTEPSAVPDSPSPEPPPSEIQEPYVVTNMRDYIIYDSNTRLLTEQELAQYSNAELVIARNEIYARHGYKFGSKILIDWFGSKWWYTPVYESSEFNNSLLSATENANINLLLEYRNRRNNGEVPYQGSGAEDLYYYQYFYDSDTRYIMDSELIDMTKDNLEIAIYEVYARNNMAFSDPRWLEYYKSFTWYSPTIPESSWSINELNTYELANLELMQYYYSLK